MNVAFVDLKQQYLSLKEEMDKAIFSILDQTTFIGGEPTRSFESQFAKALGVKHCIGVGNGTDAIYIALKMLGVGSGDEVITTAASWISTSETISQTGAKPVFVDIHPEEFTIDIDQIEAKISPRTKAIIPVHFYGQAARIAGIRALCDKHQLFLIEDCAQSHFTKEGNRYVGTFGHAATFSFYPGKNLGAYGDAGAVVTNDDELARKMRMYANHGALKKHAHEMEGINSRLDTLQAAILNVKLPHIHEWNRKRQANAAVYTQLLRSMNLPLRLPLVRENTEHTFHLYVVQTDRRDELKAFLEEQGVQTAIHYPTALPNLKAYQYLGHQPSDFPVASKWQNQSLSLPMYPELTTQEIEYVCEKIRKFFAG